MQIKFYLQHIIRNFKLLSVLDRCYQKHNPWYPSMANCRVLPNRYTRIPFQTQPSSLMELKSDPEEKYNRIIIGYVSIICFKQTTLNGYRSETRETNAGTWFRFSGNDQILKGRYSRKNRTSITFIVFCEALTFTWSRFSFLVCQLRGTRLCLTRENFKMFFFFSFEVNKKKWILPAVSCSRNWLGE